MMKKPALSLSLVLLVGCTQTPVQNPTPSPTPAPTASPAPSAPAFKGHTVLVGQVDIDAQSVVIEASNATGTFRQSSAVNNGSYRIDQVPVGERIRVVAQYQNNTRVILSASIDIAESQKEQETALNVDLESTALDLIYQRAAANGRATIVNTPIETLRTSAEAKVYRDQVLQVLQEIFASPIDAIQVAVPTAPSVEAALDTAVPAIDAILQNQPVPSAEPSTAPSPTPSATPSTTPSNDPAAPFTAVSLLPKPGNEVQIAKDTSLRLWAVGVDASGNQQTVAPEWTLLSKTGTGNVGPDGVFTPTSAGTFVIRASFGSLSEDITVTVNDGELESLELIPDSDFTLSVGQRFELQAKGRDETGAEVTVTPTWEISNTFVAQVNENGVFIPQQAGRVDVTARARGFVATITITVESSFSTLIESFPKEPTVLVGKTQPIQVFARDASGGSSSTTFNFSVADASIGNFLSQDTSITGSLPTVVFQALKPGTTTVTARDVLSNRTITFPLTVADNSPYISSISPANSVLVPGQTVTLNGENFSSVPNSNVVTFNSVRANVIQASATQLQVTVPVGAFSGFINVSSEGRKGSGFPFVITPVLDNVIPNEANENDLITLTGQHFSTDNPAHNVAFFGSQPASIPINVTNNSMQVRVPGNLTSDIQVSVRVKGQLSNFRDFDVAGASIPNWSEKSAASTSRSGAHARQFDGNIYVLGGFQSGNSDQLDIYNISNNSWSAGANLPVEQSRLALVEVDDRLFAIAGNRIFRYDPGTNAWTAGGDLQDADNNHVGGVAEEYRGDIYVIGGQGSDGRIVEKYDVDADSWSTLRNSPSRRYDAASAIYNGRIYVIGGGDNSAEDRITAYDIEDDEWIVGLKPMPKALTGCRAVLIGAKIYVVGGEESNGVESDAVYEYDPTQDEWRTLRRLPSARHGAAVSSISSRLYVIGGENSSGNTTNTTFQGSL